VRGAAGERDSFGPIFAGCVGVAVLQTVLGQRLSGRYLDDYWVTLGTAWTAALVLVWESRGTARTTPRSERRLSRLVGGAAVAAALVPFVTTPVYHAFHRVLPLLAGAGLCLLAFGPRGLWAYRRELLLLALPVVNPLPQGIRYGVAPTSWTAWTASLIGRGAGHSMTADGSFIRMPTGTLDVLADCGGLLSVGRLWALAAVVIALFPTSGWQKAALVVSAVVLGFIANAVRIEMLAVIVAQGNSGGFDYWHSGPGASVFALATTAAAGPVWWSILRRPRSGVRPRTLPSPGSP
jgi:cyanoexosortase A